MNARIPPAVEVAVIGAGPVGLTASLLLGRFGVSHVVVEQLNQPTDHPQAHFISCRSMEVFRELDGLDRRIRNAGAPLKEWRHYVYCTDLTRLPGASEDARSGAGSLLVVTDHFPHGPDHGISPTWESNLPQHVLVGLLRDAAVRNTHGRLLEGFRAEIHEIDGAVQVALWETDGDRRQTIDSRYVICADGARSNCRDLLGIRRARKTPVLQHLINVHFFSLQLADLLRERIMGMLYFVYTPDGIGVFVNHSLQKGEFVLQLPFFPAHQDAGDFTAAVCADIITKLVGTAVETDIRSVRPWRLGAWVAERFQSRSGRCFLTGDAAHQVLPAGGFGMNCGIAEAHNLAWKLAQALDAEKRGREAVARDLLETYDAERRPVAERYLEISKKNFDKTLAVASAIGLDWRAARGLDGFVRMLPVPKGVRRGIFNLGMRTGLAQVKLLNSDNLVAAIRRRDLEKLFSDPDKILQMRFPRQELGVVYHRGWMEGTVETDFNRTNAVEFQPDWVKGARLPHFRIKSARAGDPAPISSLDLPAIAADRHGGPVHVLLAFGLSQEKAQPLADELDSRFFPVETIRIGSLETSAEADYVYESDPPPFASSPSAVLVRPDGHLAWIWEGPTAPPGEQK